MRNAIIMLCWIGAIGQLNAQSVVNEDFNATDGNWVASSNPTGNFWEWGDPVATQINDDNGGGGNAWVTSLGGTFSFTSFTDLFLTSSAYDLSALTDGNISFALNYDLASFGFGGDALTFKYSTDGSNWVTVGSLSTGTNWYNGTGFEEGWVGNSSGWVTVSHPIPAEIIGRAQVFFRFDLISGIESGSYGAEGVGFDDFQISGTTVPDPVTASILSMTLTDELYPASIDAGSQTVKLFVSEGTVLTALAPTFTITDGATSDITSGSPQDFTTPVSMVITAADASTETWTISVETPTLLVNLSRHAAQAGASIAISGKGFSSVAADNSVTFNGTAAQVTNASESRLTVVVPDIATGNAEVLVSANGLSSRTGTHFSVLESDTEGTFADFREASFNLNVTVVNSLDTDDLDGDGDFDFIYDDGNSLKIATITDGVIESTVTVTTNRGSGNPALQLKIADIDHDGFPDIVAGGSRLGWFKNNGDGTWAEESTIQSGGGTYDIRVFDADCDFDLDIVADVGGNVTLFKNSGSGVFSLTQRSVASAIGMPYDLDEDGDMDMVAVTSSGNGLLMLKNDGTGLVFSDSTLIANAGTGLNYVTLGDLDNDGDEDFVYSNLSSGASGTGYILNNGDGTLATGVSILTDTEGPATTMDMALGDLNGDGYLDITRTHDGSSSVFEVFLSSNALTYTRTELDGSIGGFDIDLTDIDLDGDLDILQEASRSGGYFPLYKNTQNGKEIVGFTVTEETGAAVISSSNFTVNLEVNSSADITSLAPVITVSPGASISPTSGTSRDFSNSVTYTVTAEDGLTQQYTVRISQAPAIPVLSVVDEDVAQESATINWGQATAAAGYELELSTQSDFSALVSGYDPLTINSGSTTSASLTGLSMGTTYYVRLRAVNSTGTYSAHSDIADFQTRPATPVGAAASDIMTTSFTANWSAVTGLTGYVLQVSSDDFASTVAIDSTSSTSSSITGLSGATSYQYRILAYNATGESPYSSEVTVITLPTTPQLVITNSDIAQEQADIGWNAVSGAASYELELSTNSDFSSLVSNYDPLNISSGSTTTTSLTGLSTGTTYYVRLRALNSAGAYSAYSDIADFQTRPATPVGAAATDVMTTSFTANWSAVTGLTGYVLQVSSDNFASTVAIDSTSSTSSSITGLSGATSYRYRILAYNATGESPYSSEVTVITLPSTPQLVITNNDIAQEQADIGWNAVSGAASYELELSTNSDFSSLVSNYDPLNISSGSTTTTSLTGLSTGTTYYVRLRALNSAGAYSAYSDIADFQTRPATPVGAAASDIMTTSFTANWSAVTGLTGYVLQVSSDNFASTVAIDSTSSTSSSITGLSGATSYQYRILAYNATGESSYSSEVTVITLPTTPQLVITNSDIAQEQADIGWNAVSGAASYELELSTNSDFSSLVSNYDPLNISSGSTTTTSLTGLSAGTTYYVRLRASNNENAFSDYSSITSFLTRPATPVGNPATAITTTSFTASWSEVSGTDGYVLQVSSDNFASTAFVDSTSTTSMTVGTLQGATQYQYRVLAHNDTGETPYSSQVLVTTLTPNAAPTGLSLDNSTVNENLPLGTSVANMVSTDSDDEVHTYSLVSGSGDTDNSSFAIAGSELQTNEVFNHEVKNQFSIRLQTQDPSGETFSKSFVIDIGDVNDTPSAIFIDNEQEIAAFDAIGTKVGDLRASDDDDTQHTFSLIGGQESFNISGTELSIAVRFENTVDSTITLVVRAEDAGGASVDQEFSILIKPFIDTTSPEISLTSGNADTFLSGGGSVAVSATVTDFRLAEVLFYTRVLTQESFSSRMVTSASDLYTVDVLETDLSGVGMEYYFEAVDEAGNTTRSETSKIVLEFPSTGEDSPIIESVQKFGRSIDNYQIIALPYLFSGTNNRVDVIFDEYGGNPDNRTWRIIRFDNASAELVNLTASYRVAPGEGYFFIAEEPREIRVGEAVLNTQDPFTINLRAGWNLIGNPYNVDLDWNSILETNGVTDQVRSLRVFDPENPETWPESTLLQKFEGAFVQADQDINLTVSFMDVPNSAGRSSTAGRTKSGPEWLVPITVEQGSKRRTGGVGMDATATHALDRFDELVLPRWIEFLELNFPHPGEKFGNYNTDVVPLSESGNWSFEVSSSQAGPATLRWDANDVAVATMKLFDVQNAKVIDMTQQSSYEFQVQGTAQFKLMYSSSQGAAFEFEKIRTYDVYPNPVTTSFKIPMTIPNRQGDQTVSVSITDVSGQLVWSGQPIAVHPGFHEVEVERPSGVGPGIYLYKVIVRNATTTHIQTKRIYFR